MTLSAIARQWDFKLPINALMVNRRGDWLAVAMADGSFRLLSTNHDATEPEAQTAHNGISLSLGQDADELGFLSGGDDGRLLLIEPGVDTPTLLAEHKHQWIDHVAASIEGQRAYAIGKNLYRLDEKGESLGAPLSHTSSIGGLAYSPNGKRLAASHYNGISLWWTNAKDAAPLRLGWKGSHLPVVWHPDGKIVLTAMQENALHGWRLSDNREMQMQGYAAKIQSLGFTPKGKFLATSGAEQIICWPFMAGGPWGKPPLTLGGISGKLVSRVAPHPKDELVAAGYEDGMIVMAPLDGRMEVMIHPPVAEQGSAVTGLAWNGAGDALFAALESGYLMLFTVDSVSRAVKAGG